MLAALRQHNFALLWVGQLISVVGDLVLRTALPFYIYAQTGSALATGTMFMVQTIPGALLGSVAGVFIDRWDYKWTMILADLLRAILLLSLLLVRGTQWFWLIYLIAFGEATISTFFGPAKDALLPKLIDAPHLLAANSLNAVSHALTYLVGPALGGALLGVLGFSSVVILDAVTYVLSGILIARIVMPPAEPCSTSEPPRAAATAGGVLWHDWRNGLRVVQRDPVIAVIFIVMGISAFAQGVINVLFVVFATQVLRVDAVQFGWLVGVQGVGALCGGLIIGQIRRFISPTRLIIMSEWAVGTIFLTVWNVPVLPVALILYAFLGVAATGYSVSTLTLLQSNVDEHFRGRVFGTLGTILALMLLGGMGLASGLGDYFGVMTILDIAGGLFLIAGVIALVLWRDTANRDLVSTLPSHRHGG